MKIQSRKLLLCSLLALSSIAQAVEVPTGTISVKESVIRTGTFPRISWNIIYPEPEELLEIDELVTISPSGGILPKTDLNMTVRALAADIQTVEWHQVGRRWVQRIVYVDVSGFGRVNSEPFRHLFTGTQPEVEDEKVLWTRKLKDGDVLRFCALTHLGTPAYCTGTSSENVLVLKNGDIPPSIAGWKDQASLGTHIAPYLDSSGAIKIGPRDLIVAYELFFPMPHPSGDLQDMIFLVTFQHDLD